MLDDFLLNATPTNRENVAEALGIDLDRFERMVIQAKAGTEQGKLLARLNLNLAMNRSLTRG